MTTATETKSTFQHLAQRISKEAEQKQENARFYIENGYLESWHDGKTKNDNGIKNESTATRWKQYQNGEITREKAVEYATRRRLKEIDRETIKKQDKLLRARDAEEIKSVSISVDWKRSNTWGYNPTATVIINGIYEYRGTASGCGYDKETAAVGTALNQSIIILKMLYTAKEKALASMPPEESEAAKKGYIEGCETNRAFIHYGAGYGVLPCFEGGVGMTSFRGVFEACGLKCTHTHETKHTDFYYFEKGATK